MRAYIIDSKNQTVRLVEKEKPVIGDDEVLIKCLRWSICRTDVSQVRNELGEDADGLVPGHEVLGVIVESNDPRFAIGEHVVYMGATDFGGAAEYRALRCVLPTDPPKGAPGSATEWIWTDRYFYDVPGAAVIRINPANDILRRYGSLLEPLCCVLRAIEKYQPVAGENVVILGAGVIGTLALQVMKSVYGVGDVAILDTDHVKLGRVEDIYRKRYGDGIKTFHVTTPDEEVKQSFADDPAKKTSKVCNALVDYSVPEYEELLRSDNRDLYELVESTKGAFATYLFEALPPLPRDQEFPHTRYLGATLLAPDSRYVLFSAEGIEERTKFFWPILSNGLNLHAAGFDQRCYSMPQTAVVLQKALSYVESGLVDLSILVTKHVEFDDEAGVQQAFKCYGDNDYMWKTMVHIAD